MLLEFLEAVSSREFGIPTENIVNYAAGTLGIPNFGYFAGGISGYLSFVERMDFANDSATPVAKGPLSGGKVLWQQQVMLPLVTMLVELIII